MLNIIGSKLIKNSFFGFSQKNHKITVLVISLCLGMSALACACEGKRYLWKILLGGEGAVELSALLIFKLNKNEQNAFRARLTPGDSAKLRYHWLGAVPHKGPAHLYRNVALEIIDYVARLKIISHNHCATYIASSGEDAVEVLKRKGEAIETHRAHMRRIENKLKNQEDVADEGVPKHLAQAYRKNIQEGGDGSEPLLAITAFFIEKDKEGNCGELTVLALKFGTLLYPDIPMQEICIERKDNSAHSHVFLRIGEGEDAVICDPWSKPPADASRTYLHERGICFLQKDCERYLKNCLGVDERGNPLLESYNSHTDDWILLSEYNPSLKGAHRMRRVAELEDELSPS